MKTLWRLIIPVVALLVSNYCLAGNGQVVVRVNNQDLQIIPPKEAETSNTLQTLIEKRIRRAIIDSAIKEAKITVSDELLSKCMDLYIVAGDESPTNIVAFVSTRSAIVIQALRKAVLDHESKDDVYNKYLSATMTRSEWETWLKSYASKEKIDKLETLTPHSVADLKRLSQDSLRRDIEVWLLFQKLTNGLSPSPDDIQALYSEKYPAGTPSFVEVGDEIKTEATKKLREEYLNKWWQEQLVENNVEVPIEFLAVKELIKPAPKSPFLPDSVISVLEKYSGN